jgi:rubrerythrin
MNNSKYVTWDEHGFPYVSFDNLAENHETLEDAVKTLKCEFEGADDKGNMYTRAYWNHLLEIQEKKLGEQWESLKSAPRSSGYGWGCYVCGYDGEDEGGWECPGCGTV